MLYLAYPDIPWRSTRHYSAATWLTDQPYQNAIFSERYHYAQTSTAAWSIEFDLGSGVTSTANYLILAKAAAIKASAGIGNLVISTGSAGIGGAYTAQSTTAFGSVTLTGDDYLLTGLSIGAARSHKISFSGGAANAVFSKLYYGTAFDFGRSPDEFSFERFQPNQPAFIAESGAAADMVRRDDFIYRFSINWNGLSDATVRSFFDTVVKYSHIHRFFLYTTGYHGILNGLQLAHVKLVSHTISNEAGVADQNRLETVFEQVLG